jgi:hypothetical protein
LTARKAPLSEPRFDAKLRAITGASGGTLLPDTEALAGFVTLESDRVEWKFPGGERLCGGLFSPLSIITELPTTVLYNPEGSGLLGIVQRLHFSFTVAGNSWLRRIYRGSLATLTAAGYLPRLSGPLDTRDDALVVTGGTGLTVLEADVVATVGGNAYDNGPIAVINEQYIDDSPMVLAEGTGAIVEANTVLVRAMQGGWLWVERPVQSRRGS